VAGGRDDSFTLYGFASKQERELYRLLITVPGVGGNTARMIISSVAPPELANIIASGNERMLKSVKGIGLKTAQRIIVDLRDKVVALGITSDGTATSVGTAAPMSPATATVRDEAVSALTMLGFSPAPTAKAVNAILQEQPDLPVEQVVKLALKQMK
jgi:Holliday junction DNA helicase subunit RuvA